MSKNLCDYPRKKIQNFLKSLVLNFQKNYILSLEITIDESLIHFTGKNKIKFYLPMKSHKYDFKIHLLFDSKNQLSLQCNF